MCVLGFGQSILWVFWGWEWGKILLFKYQLIMNKIAQNEQQYDDHDHEGSYIPQQDRQNNTNRNKWLYLTFAIVTLLFLWTMKPVSFYMYNDYQVNITDRAKLGQPIVSDNVLVYWKISKKNAEKGVNSNCVLVNAGNLVTLKMVNSVLEFLSQPAFERGYLVARMGDIKGRQLIVQKLWQFKIQQNELEFDSELEFGLQISQHCRKVVYMFGHFHINEEMASKVNKQMSQMTPFSLFFTSQYQKGKIVKKTTDLRTMDFSAMEMIDFYSYLYIFDSQSIGIFAPVSFDYYAKYTLEHVLLIPALVFFQSLEKLTTSSQIMHQVGVSLVQQQQFIIRPPHPQRNSLCFVSYPNNPYQIDEANAIRYLQSVQDQQLQNVTVIIYLPYSKNLQNNKGISTIGLTLLQMVRNNPFWSFKIKIMAQKVSPSHAVYESVYSFCPTHALVISSRHNVVFHGDMALEFMKYVSQKHHYYFFAYEDEMGKKFDLSGLDYDYEFIQKKGNIFSDRMRPLQIFKSDLFKMIPFWILKSAEIDFYETQAPFVINMMQTIKNLGFTQIGKVLATVYDRPLNKKEAEQIENIRPYSVFTPMYTNYLMPYLYNSLENPVFRRNAPARMPAKIHQIWLSKTQNLSQVRQALHESLKKANPNFQFFFWRNQNLTHTNLPLTYNLIISILEKNKQSSRKIFAMAADLMRYEFLVHHGGIYVDFKWQGNKPFDNFLKYESFFNDFQNQDIRFGRPKVLGNGFIASIPNNYHLKMVLTEIIKQETFSFGMNIPSITGGWLLRRAFTDHEIFTQINLGYHLVIPKAYEKAEEYCGGQVEEKQKEKASDPNQKFYQVRRNGKIFRFPIPCELYPESYGVLFSPLAGTWTSSNADLN